MVSIIVPVYNTEKYLRRCIESILKQTYKDFEVILVDDGSTDDSGKMCDDYAAKNSNLRVLHSKNEGPSAARNRGREASIGEYITFVDSDDVISPDYLEVLHNLVEKYDAEISCCEFNFFTDKEELVFDTKNGIERCLTGEQAASQMLYGRLHGSSACAILMKREIAEGNTFSNGKYHEDDLVSFKYYLSANKVAVTSKRMYWYYQRPGSIMHSEYGQIAIDELDAADYIVNTCRNYNSIIKNASYVKKYCNYRDVLATYPNIKKLSPEIYGRIKCGIKSVSKQIIKDKNAGKKLRLSALKCLVLGV